MKHILFIDGTLTEADVEAIRDEMINTRVEFTISIATGSVTIEGSNDAVYSAKQAIQQAGYRVR